MTNSKRRGFTLPELLIVVAILLVLTWLVASAFTASSSGDKLRSAARSAQSSFLGARDRALHAKAKRGIRLLRDANEPALVTGFAYIQPIENLFYPDHSIRLERRDEVPSPDGLPDSPDVIIVRGFVSPDPPPVVDWNRMVDFFASPPRIRIPARTGPWYTFYWTTSGQYALTPSQQCLQLTTSFVEPGLLGVIAHDRSTTNFSSCEIELAPELLPHHAPMPLPSGVVIDLNNSSPNIAANWPPPAAIDIMFTPRGMVSGGAAALGPIHLLLRDIQDAVAYPNPIDPASKGEMMILTIFPQTGHVATFPANPTDGDGNGFADDLFKFARLGQAAGN
ncbi:MAG: Tfp pilus assembly protein FimT/FimU [Planctomycetales bacterium]